MMSAPFMSLGISIGRITVTGLVKNTREMVQKSRGTAKVNVWCALSHNEVKGLFFFHEPTVRKENYLDMLAEYAMPIITDGENEGVIFQQDGAPPHRSLLVTEFLDEKLPGRWCGWKGGEVWRKWLARSPD